jgi:hypothetical protein
MRLRRGEGTFSENGYFIVLLTDGSSNEGVAWRRMERCREKLLAEM